MKAGSKLYLPLFGIVSVLTVSSVAWWASSDTSLANTLLWGIVLVALWGFYFFITRKKA